jgi:putative membrane protein
MTARYLSRRGFVLGVAALVVGVLVLGTASAVAGGVSPVHAGDMPMDGGQMQGPSGPFLWWMPFVMPVLWLGLLAGAVFLVYWLIDSVASTDSALAELDRAFARGEISGEEYERRRERLKA